MILRGSLIIKRSAIFNVEMEDFLASHQITDVLSGNGS
jgi:hypothetical protein